MKNKRFFSLLSALLATVMLLGALPLGTFESCTELKKVTLPESLTEICENAFFGCTSLVEVNIGENVTKIGKTAFAQCYSLESIDLPASLEEVGMQAFYGADCVVKTAEGVSVVDGWIVGAPASIIKVTIGEDIIGVANGAFVECYILTDVYYTPGETAFAKIKIGEENEPLTEATIHYE